MSLNVCLILEPSPPSGFSVANTPSYYKSGLIGISTLASSGALTWVPNFSVANVVVPNSSFIIGFPTLFSTIGGLISSVTTGFSVFS